MNDNPNASTPAIDRSQRPVWLGEDRRGWDHVRIHVALLKDRRIAAHHLAVYMGVASHAELASGRAYPAATTLARYAGMSDRKVRACLHEMEEWGYLRIEHDPGRASTYVLLPPPPLHLVQASTPAPGAGHPGTTRRTTPAPGADEQEPENKIQEPLARKRASSIPPAFAPDEAMRAWAATKTPTLDVDAETEVFVDYWQGRGKAMKDWTATWRNWMRRTAKDRVETTAPVSGTSAAARRLEERTRRVQAGEACPLCQDAGIILGEDSMARPCSCRRAS